MKKYVLSLALLVSVSLSVPVEATNGYWTHGYGPKSKSMAGACVAMAFGAMCAASNPASLAVVGNRIEVGASLFAPKRGYTADANLPPGMAPIEPGKVESENDLFLIPHFAANYMLDEVSSIGIAIGGNGGMNTEYDRAVFARFNPTGDPQFDASSPTGIDLKQMFIGISYSRLLNEQHSIGITPIISIQSFSATGLEPFKLMSESPDHVTGNGTDVSYGGGLRVGWLWLFDEQLKIGASYQTKMWMSDFDKYKGLFAEQGNFDIPANFDLGFSYIFLPDWTFSFDFQRILFSGVNAIGNSSVGPVPPLMGSDEGYGFGWDDMNVYKFGLQWFYSQDLTLRAGFSQASKPFENQQALFNLLAPAVVRQHYTAGFGWRLESESEINVSFMYAPEERVGGTSPMTGPQTGEIWMSQWEIEVGWATSF